LSDITYFDTDASLCRGYPTEWWFPDNDGTSKRNAKQAIEICKQCPSLYPCLQYALRNETHGIWGGMRETERELYRRERGIELSELALTSMSNSARRVRRLENKKQVTF